MTRGPNTKHDAQRMRANDKGRIHDLEQRLTALVTSSDRLELLGAILDAFDNTIVITDPNQPDNPIIYVNGGFEKLTGYGPDEVIGQNCRFLQGEDRDQEGVTRLREAVRAGESVDVELRNYRKGGAMFWNHLYLSPVYDDEGKLVLFLGVQNDVTARKEATEEVKRARDTLEERIRERTGELDESNQALRLEVEARERAEREVRASESKLLDVLDHLLTFVAVLDKDGTLQYINRAALDASDVTLATVIGLPFAEIPWWRHDSAIQARLREAIRKAAHGETSRYDERVRMSEDRVLTVDFMLAPVRDAQGNVSSLVASATDVTEREKAQETLEETAERLQLLISEAQDYAIVITDQSGVITEWSPGAERVMGQREAEVLGRHIDLIFNPHDTRQGRAETEMRLARNEGSAKDVRWHLRQDGTRFFADGTMTALRNEAGELRGFAKVFRDSTEQKIAEDALRKSEEQRRVALEAAAMGTWDIDIVNGAFDMDKRGRELFDLPSEGSLSLEEAISHIHPDERDDVAQQVEEVTRSSEAGDYDLEYRVLKPEGGVRWIRATGQALFEGAGTERRAMRFVGVLTETTEQRETEIALRKSEAEYRTLFETMTQAVVYQDAEGEIISANPAGERILGLTNDEMTGRYSVDPRWRALREDGSDFPGEEHPPMRALRTGQIVENVVMAVYNPNDERYRWLSVDAVPQYRPGETEPFQVYSLFDDITVRKEAQEALKESERNFRGTFENAAVGIGHVGLGGQWLKVNAKLCDISGYSEAELLARTFQDITHPEDVGADIEQFEQLMRGDIDSYTMEKRYFHKGGHIVWIDLTTALQRGESGEPLYCISVVEEVTARKEAEAEVLKLNQELENRVEARTAELRTANVQLKDRTAALEAANKELEAFSYSVSHDLRAPLRGIDGFSQALLEDFGVGDTLDETGVHYLERVRSGAQRMGVLIDDMLAFSRLSRSEMRREAVDLSAKAASIVADLREREPGRNVSFEIQSGLCAQGDRRLLRIALTNLFENAWKFTRHEDEARITFCRDEEGAFFVRDNGVGFDMAYANKLFGAFQRLHSPGQFEGTGIGLATVQRVVHRHGGEVWAEAAVNEGATFYFMLPLASDSPTST